MIKNASLKKTENKKKRVDDRRHSKKDGGTEKWKNDGGRYKMLDQEVHKMCDKAKE